MLQKMRKTTKFHVDLNLNCLILVNVYDLFSSVLFILADLQFPGSDLCYVHLLVFCILVLRRQYLRNCCVSVISCQSAHSPLTSGIIKEFSGCFLSLFGFSAEKSSFLNTACPIPSTELLEHLQSFWFELQELILSLFPCQN